MGHELIRPLPLGRLSASIAQARNALLQRVRYLPWPWGGQRWNLTIEPARACPPDAGPAGLWRLQCQWGGAGYEGWVDADAARAWVQASFPSLDLPSLPPAFASAVMDAALAPLGERLTGLNRGALRVESFEPWPTDQALPVYQPDQQALDLVARCGSESIRLRLVTGSLGLMLAAALVTQVAPAVNAIEAGRLPMRLHAQIGATWLTSSQIESLSLGDLVLMDQVLLTPQRELWLSLGPWGLRVQWGESAFTALSPLTFGGFTMPDTAAPAPSDEQAAGLDVLPLCVTFDLGQREITLGELRQIQAGQVIELGQALTEPVNLRVGGVLVARASLVEVDGRLGVTVTQIQTAGSAATLARPAQAQPGHKDHGQTDRPQEAALGRDRGDPEDLDLSEPDELPTGA